MKSRRYKLHYYCHLIHMWGFIKQILLHLSHWFFFLCGKGTSSCILCRCIECFYVYIFIVIYSQWLLLNFQNPSMGISGSFLFYTVSVLAFLFVFFSHWFLGLWFLYSFAACPGTNSIGQLTSNSQRYAYFFLPSVGIKVMHRHYPAINFSILFLYLIYQITICLISPISILYFYLPMFLRCILTSSL